MIRITKQGVVSSNSVQDLEGLRLQFDRDHCVRLPEFLTAELLEFIQQRLDQAEFYTRIHEEIGSNKELCLAEHAITGVLHFLLNSQPVFGFIQNLTQCEPIGCILGRIYRVVPGCGHHDAWHSDLGDHRLIALSVNLSRAVYAGGLLQIRERHSKQILHQVANTGPGDAIVFRLATNLQHRLTEVEGTVAKTAFAGWFKSQPSFLSLLRNNLPQDRTS